MKHILFALFVTACVTNTQITHSNTDELAQITRPVSVNSEKLNSLRNQISATVLQVQSILNQLCGSLQHTLGAPADVICQQLSLLSTCTQTISARVPDMNERELAHLLDINQVLVENIERHIIDEDYDDATNFESTELFSALSTEQRIHFITVEQIEKKLTRLQDKIALVSALVNQLAATAAEAVITEQASHWNPLQFISNHKGTLTLGALTAGLAYLLRNQNPTVVLKEIVVRLPIYTLVALYVLRQKKDGDVKRWSNGTFGENSIINSIVLAIKQAVGSPREKRTGIQVTIRPDMSVEEQIAWIEKNNCEVVKVDYKKRSIPFLGTFFDLDDSLFKWSFSWIFAQQVRADVLALSKLMGENAEDVVKKILNPGK